MIKKLIIFIRKQSVFLSGVAFGAATSALVLTLFALITDTELLDIAEVLDLLDCYEERIDGKK